MIKNLTVSCFLLSFSLAASSQNAAALLKSGDAKMAAKNYAGAIQDYSSAVTMNEPTVAEYQKKLADYNKLTEYQKMLRDDGPELTKGGHDLAMPYHSRGIAFAATLEYPEALKNFDMAIAIDPKFPDAYYQRALINQKAGNKNEACIDMKIATEMGHAKAKEEYGNSNCANFSTNYYNDGLSKVGEKDYNGAINDFTLALRMSNDTSAYFNRGMCYYLLAKYDKAIVDFNKAMSIEIDSLQNAQYPFMVGMCYYTQEKYKQAYEAYTKAVKVNANHYGAFLHRGYCNENMAQIPSADYDYTNAARIRPKDGLAFYKLAQMKTEQNNSKAACDNYKKAAQLGYEDAKLSAKDCLDAERKERQQ